MYKYTILLMTMIIKYANIISIEFIIREFLLKKVFNSVILIFSFLIPLLTISCSNTQESKLVYTENNTIKQNVKEREQDITWTMELEGERLTKKINRGSMQLGSDVPYTKDLYKISKTYQRPVYPSIEDFGSLDTRDLRVSVKEKVNTFCTAFASEGHIGADSYFSKKYIFNYVFFLKDFEEGWIKYFGKLKTNKSSPFKKWLFGEPFNGPDFIQIPVRFYADCGTIDMTMFLNSSGNNEFYQITIDRWQKYDGTRQTDRN